jgi:hypothetical protein
MVKANKNNIVGGIVFLLILMVVGFLLSNVYNKNGVKEGMDAIPKADYEGAMGTQLNGTEVNENAEDNAPLEKERGDPSMLLPKDAPLLMGELLPPPETSMCPTEPNLQIRADPPVPVKVDLGPFNMSSNLGLSGNNTYCRKKLACD